MQTYEYRLQARSAEIGILPIQLLPFLSLVAYLGLSYRSLAVTQLARTDPISGILIIEGSYEADM